MSLAAGGCSSAKLLLAPPSAPPARGASSTVDGPAYAPAALVYGPPDPSADWGAYNKTLGGNRYSPLAQKAGWHLESTPAKIVVFSLP